VFIVPSLYRVVVLPFYFAIIILLILIFLLLLLLCASFILFFIFFFWVVSLSMLFLLLSRFSLLHYFYFSSFFLLLLLIFPLTGNTLPVSVMHQVSAWIKSIMMSFISPLFILFDVESHQAKIIQHWSTTVKASVQVNHDSTNVSSLLIF